MSTPRRVGLPRAQDVAARDVVKRTRVLTSGYDTAGNQPLPSPYTPAVVTPNKVGIVDPGSKLTFLFGADWGGIENPAPQKAVIAAMAARLPGPAFLYGGGDQVYFNGDPAQYAIQLYQPLAHFPIPVVAVPGNHDGDPTDGVPGAGVDSFMVNFCAAEPGLPPSDPHDEYGRDTQIQPSHDWGMVLEAATMLGVWTNVKSGGHLYSEQIQWLTSAVKEAPADRPLIFVCHHPPFSISADGGSSPELNSILDSIWADAGRWPDLILSGHVHDFQVFTRTVSLEQKPVRYVVCGCSGYHNLHAIAGDYQPGMELGDGITCDFADGTHYGFLQIIVEQGVISGEYVQVTESGEVTPNAYTFSIA